MLVQAKPAQPATTTPPGGPRFVQLHHEDREAVRDEITQGLLAARAQLSPKFLYDALGSHLFEAITELPEYYPTRTEAAIFERHGAQMARHVPRGATLVDLGAGNCAKAARLFGLLAPARYVAVDISVEFLREALASLQDRHPAMEMVGVGMDFTDDLTLPPLALGNRAARAAPRVLFFPGSSIGNFEPVHALAFLRRARLALEDGDGRARGGLLVGVDLVKPRAELEAAYDDALGVTAAFNLNLLQHVNRIAGSDFRVRDWQHVALYDEDLCRIEMHLQARRDLRVRWPGGERAFRAGERIHTENSCKWTVDGFASMLREAGFGAAHHWCDEQQRFAVFWATGAA